MTISSSLPDALALDMGFGDDGVEVVKPTLQPNPVLVYMTGNLTTTTFETAVGWHVPADVNPVLDELLATRGTKRYVVEHKTGDDRQKPYWNLNANGAACSLIPIAYGLKSTWQMGREPEDRVGIAYGVGIATERDGTVQISQRTGRPKKKPQLQMRVYIHELLDKEHPERGFNEWFQVSLSNYLVDHMMTALTEQFRVLEAFNALMSARNNTNRAQYWGFSIPMVPGTATPVGPKGTESTIYPMVAQIPEQLPVNSPATIQFLQEHRIPLHIQEALRNGVLDDTVVWSVQRSLDIVKDPQQVTVTEDPGNAIEGAAMELPQLPPAADSLVDADQVKWVRETYCGNNPAIITQICQAFGVQDLTQLRVSQYRMLENQVKR